MKRFFATIFMTLFVSAVAFGADCSDGQMEYNGQCVDAKFTLTTSVTDSFSIEIGAAGTFYIDWGDGNVEEVARGSRVTEEIYPHEYTGTRAEQPHTIRIGGLATGYNHLAGSTNLSRAIAFNITKSGGDANVKKVTGISGSLGLIFPTQNPAAGFHRGRQPLFDMTFLGASNMTGSIPAELFNGISGAPRVYMFMDTFNGCTGLTGPIPEDLFSGLNALVADAAEFYGTFRGCNNLSGPIPGRLFSRLVGRPGGSTFSYTFSGCSGLTGPIPEDLFAGLTGAPSGSMFFYTFNGCSGLTGPIPGELFAGISGAPAENMFYATFNGCSGLTGPIPGDLFAGISGTPANNMFYATFNGCRGLTGPIPGDLFAGISGTPANNMFYATFKGCSGLTGPIPEDLFEGISGAPRGGMFRETFNGCSGLTGQIPEDLFAGISGAPAGTMFYSTFKECSGLTGFTDGTDTWSYVPKSFLENISDGSESLMVQAMFAGTSLSATCPDGTVNVTRSQFNNAGKPWCAPACSYGYHYNDDFSQCIPYEISLTYYDDSEIYVTDTCVYDTAFVLPATPQKREGYVFNGWKLVE